MSKKIITIIITIISILCLMSIFIYNNNTKYDIKDGFRFGKRNAPVKIIEYSSFECGTCKEFHMKMGDVINKYVEEGIVEYIFRAVDIDRFDYDDKIFKHIYKKDLKNLDKINEIFEKQDEWKMLNSKEEIIKFLNLNEEENKDNLEQYIWKRDELLKLDIRNVPTVYINNEKIDINIEKQEFEDLINEKYIKNN